MTKVLVRKLKVFSKLPREQVNIDVLLECLFVASQVVTDAVERKDFDAVRELLTKYYNIIGKFVVENKIAQL